MKKEPTYIMYSSEGLEGVFSSINEMAAYLDVPPTIIRNIKNGDYEDLPTKYAEYEISIDNEEE